MHRAISACKQRRTEFSVGTRQTSILKDELQCRTDGEMSKRKKVYLDSEQ